MQDNEKKPALRFKGFTDPWEQRKVGELLTERNEQAPMSDEYPLMAFIAMKELHQKANDMIEALWSTTQRANYIRKQNLVILFIVLIIWKLDQLD